MTVKRIINGEPVEITLTDLELLEAYAEQRKIGYKEDVVGYLDEFADNEETEQFYEMYEVPLHVAYDHVDEIAVKYLDFIDKYNTAADLTLVEAISSTLKKYA